MINETIASSLAIPADRDILVCIFQRGAADGLNSVVPYGDPFYYAQRGIPGNPGSISVPEPTSLEPNPAIDLDGFFGLHPALAPLKAIYDANDLAIVHATGMPHGSRSHFSAQGLIERGVTEKSGPDTGWVGRHLAITPAASSSAFRIVSISGNVPVALTGANEPLAISNIGEFGFEQDIIDAGYPTVLNSLYRSPVPFYAPAKAALSAMDELAVANPSAITPQNGADYGTSVLGNKLKQVGQLIRSTLPVEVICVDSDNWDHHESLPNYIDLSLTEMADAISAFYTDMGTGMDRITLMVYTEFGRRVGKNASQGTDHGTGGVAYFIGGGVNGGQVIGGGTDWPGLDTPDLELGEDLKITTDLRTVQAELLNKRLGGTDISTVFPDFTGPQSANVFLNN